MEQSNGAGRTSAVIAGVRCQIDIDVDGRYFWRLIAPNGRSVAVSAVPHQSHEECREAFVQLCARHERLGGGVQHSTGEGAGWVWALWEVPGRRLAMAARTYERHATCRAAFERFRSVLPQLTPQRPEMWGET